VLGLAEESWFKLNFGYGELTLLEAPDARG
jgi:hypothetical protein